MKKRYLITITSIIVILVLVGSLLYYSLVSAQGPGDYDPWYDLNDDGKIDMRDIGGMARKFGTTGTPINKTELLLDLQAKIDALNDTIDSLLSPGVEEARDLISQTIAPTGGAILEQRAVLPVDPNKNTAISNQIVSASVPNRTTPGLFEKYFPRGIFS